MLRIVTALFLTVAAPATLAGEHPGEWQPLLEDLRSQRDGLLEQLKQARATLLPRVRGTRPDLLPRLELDPSALVSGYGILPELEDDAPPAPVLPRQTIYSLERLERRFASATTGASALLTDGAGGEIEALSAEFERLRKDLRNLEHHISYHDYWQQAIVDYPRFYAERNRLVTTARELDRLRQADGSEARIAALREEIVDKIAPFRKVDGLVLRRTGDGRLRLPVTVCTDIRDRGFLRAFRRGVDEAYRRSAAARARRFSVQLKLRHVPPRRLYPDGAPAIGAAFDRRDQRDHRARFAGCGLVLTTGAASTHAWVGDSVMLGPAPISRRTLAHEFSHLLGFSDAYLRGFDATEEGRVGAVIVEWTGLSDDLMGAPGHGSVSGAMIDRLIAAYLPED